MITHFVDQLRQHRSIYLTSEFLNSLLVSPEDAQAVLEAAAGPDDQLRYFYDPMHDFHHYALIGPAERDAYIRRIREAIEELAP